MKELRLKKLTQARMEQWLREHPNTWFYTRDSRSCPVAAFLKSMYPKATIHTVGTDGGSITPKGRIDVRRFALPRWAREFIKLVDSGSYLSVNITSKAALRKIMSV